MISSRINQASNRRAALAVAIGLLPACVHPGPAGEATSAPPPRAATAAAPAPPSATFTVFEGFAGAPAWPEAIPAFPPLAPVFADLFAACPQLRATTTVELPMTAGRTTTLALPGGGEARIAWESDPATLRLQVEGDPRGRPGGLRFYALSARGGAIMFWAPSQAVGDEAAGACAYVVVGYGA